MSSIGTSGTPQTLLHFSQVEIVGVGLALVRWKLLNLLYHCHLVNASETRAYLSACLPLLNVNKLPPCGPVWGRISGPSYSLRTVSHSPQQSKQTSAVFSKEVHMEGDSLCLPAAVALLRPWLNRSVAICSGPRYRERKPHCQYL